MIISPVISPWAPAAGWRLMSDEACDFGEKLLEAIEQLQRALRVGVVLIGVQRRETRVGCHPLVDPRVVLHGATAQWVEVLVDAEYAMAQPGEVADQIQLAHVGQIGHAIGEQASRDARGVCRGHVRFRKRHGARRRRALLEDKRQVRIGFQSRGDFQCHGILNNSKKTQPIRAATARERKNHRETEPRL
jgi:hypothetical protein